MKPIKATRISSIDNIAKQLCDVDSLKNVLHCGECEHPMPSHEALKEIISRLKAIIFPGYFVPLKCTWNLSATISQQVWTAPTAF